MTREFRYRITVDANDVNAIAGQVQAAAGRSIPATVPVSTPGTAGRGTPMTGGVPLGLPAGGMGGLGSMVASVAGPVAALAGVGLAVSNVTRTLEEYSQIAKEQIQVERQQEAVLRSTGHAAGISSGELRKMASELQGLTNYGDEAVMGAQNLLLTFQNIGSDIFPRATKSTLDLSAAFGQSLSSSAMQLGKALEDPIQGITALRRVGVSFSKDQQELIKTLVETGQVAQAQSMILDVLERQVGGSAEAIADAATQAKNAMGDLKEEIGRLWIGISAPFQQATAGMAGALAEFLKESRETSDLDAAIATVALLEEGLRFLQQQAKDGMGAEAEQAIQEQEQMLEEARREVERLREAMGLISGAELRDAAAGAADAEVGLSGAATEAERLAAALARVNRISEDIRGEGGPTRFSPTASDPSTIPGLPSVQSYDTEFESRMANLRRQTAASRAGLQAEREQREAILAAIEKREKELARERQQQNRQIARTAESEWKRAATEAQRAWEAAIGRVPGLLSLSPVTQDQMDLAAGGVPQRFADSFLRELADQIENGISRGINVGEVAQQMGIDPSLPQNAILAQARQMWASGEIWANPENLNRFVDWGAVEESLAQQQRAAQGQTNLDAAVRSRFGNQFGAMGADIGAGIGQGITNAFAGGGAGEGKVDVAGPAVANIASQFADPEVVKGWYDVGKTGAELAFTGWSENIGKNPFALALATAIKEQLYDEFRKFFEGGS